MIRLRNASLLLALCSVTGSLWADAGHSALGEAFNEGPRQAAVLIPGTGEVNFKVTTSKPIAQRFFTQGVGQLHGFWYYEAERSFRQVAKLDPQCAMAYWGMAMANVNNEKRAKAFIRKATPLKAKASPREQEWITLLEKFYNDDKRDKKQRALDCIRDLEALVQDGPDDIEAKAFLVWKIWQANDEAPMSSTLAVDTLLDQVFAANPMHPANHYRIHLWDSASKPKFALTAASRCGQAAPAIAHMWHMPGHTYSKLRRFDDAAWHQEASTRVDHAYMIRELVLPDQIHNYAHNEEWLIRTYNELGRVREGLALAENLITIPRHPTYNHLDKPNCSASYGRQRLLDTLQKWQLWDRLIQEAHGPLLGEVSQVNHDTARQRALGVAYYHLNRPDDLTKSIQALELLEKKEAEKKAEQDKKAAKETAATQKDAATPNRKEDNKTAKPKGESKEVKAIQAGLAELRALKAILKKAEDAAKLLEPAAADLPKYRLARYWLTLGNKQKVEEVLKKFDQDLISLATKTEILFELGKTDEAKKVFEATRKAAFAMDMDLPIAQRMAKLATAQGIQGDWRMVAPKRNDIGERPPINSLGPLYWHPSDAPEWEALTLQGKPLNGAEFMGGKPTILLFYLGAACNHCMQQINAFDKVSAEFAKAGIQLAAITLEPMSLATRITEQMESKKLPSFPIFCDPTLDTFKAFRAFDDFEDEPLHAAVLIDAQGKLRWLDVSWQPFMDTKFLLAESARLLKMPAFDAESRKKVGASK